LRRGANLEGEDTFDFREIPTIVKLQLLERVLESEDANGAKAIAKRAEV